MHSAATVRNGQSQAAKFVETRETGDNSSYAKEAIVPFKRCDIARKFETNNDGSGPSWRMRFMVDLSLTHQKAPARLEQKF
jgi:hypothetical protein